MNRDNRDMEAAISSHARNTGTDWHNILKQSGSITILYSRAPGIAAAILYIFFGGITLLILFNEGLTMRALLLAVANAGILALVTYLKARATSKSVKSFDSMGALTNKGEYFLWSDFRGRVLRTGVNRSGVKYTWRTELIFTGNRQLWVLPQRVKNYREVDRFLEILPLANLKDI